MGTVTQWLSPQEIALDVEVSNRWEALRAVSAMIERSHGLSAPPVFRALWRRELAASTGIGHGVAVPHARISGINEPLTAYVRTEQPVDFAAPDGSPVTELFVILVPVDDANERNLLLLAMVAEAFSDRDFRGLLDAASDPRAVHGAFLRWIRDKQLGAKGGKVDVGYTARYRSTRNSAAFKHRHS